MNDDCVAPVPAALDRLMEDLRSEPPQVYRGSNTDDWIVEPPQTAATHIGRAIFTGSQAQRQALTYAYETFGNARFFPY
jgi:hypothetical protein